MARVGLIGVGNMGAGIVKEHHESRTRTDGV